MKIVRVEEIVPGGALELHPRLTLLRGVAPEARRRLRQTMAAIAGVGELDSTGLIEVNGVQLALDAPTLAQLEIDVGLNPVLSLEDPASRQAPPLGPQQAVPTQQAPPPFSGGTSLHVGFASPGFPQPSQVSGGRQVPPTQSGPLAAPSAGPDELQLRDRLRVVGTERGRVGDQMESARAGLDSFSTAALEVCIGQIDALESRRKSLRADWERERSRLDDRRDAATGDLGRLRSVLEWTDSLDVAGVRELRDSLVELTERPAESDFDAAKIAERLEGALERVRELTSRQANVRLRESEAAQRLDEATADAASAESALRSHRVDQSVVRRLEAVRDEIFAVDDRQGRLNAARNKRRLSELRSEEAVLLDRLGFDTYSAYVMGIPSVRAEMERSSKLDSAQDRADRVSEEIERLRDEAPNPAELAIASSELDQLLSHSLDQLGEPAHQRSLEELIDGLGTGDGTSDMVYATIAALRRRRVETDERESANSEVVAERLRGLLVIHGPGWSGLRAEDPPAVTPFDSTTPPPNERRRRLDPPPVAPFASVPSDVHGAELIEFADAWLRWTTALEDWRGEADEVRSDLEKAAADLEARSAGGGIARWAEVEAELDAALDRLDAAQERVRSHEEATAELARLRNDELELRDRERDLLSAIAVAEQTAPAVEPAQMAPAGTPPTGTTELPPPFTVSTADTSGLSPSTPFQHPAGADVAPSGQRLDPLDVEWTLIARLAEQRSVSFVGSMPVLVDGLPADEQLRSALLERLDRMSDLIQILVLSDDDGVLEWLDTVGSRGRCIQL